MKSFLASLTLLILPTGASPPTVGQPIIVLDPGPPPVIKLYTGDAAETAPAQISGEVSGGNPQLVLLGPKTSGAPYQGELTIGQANTTDTPFMEFTAEDFSFFDGMAVPLLKLKGTDSFSNPYAPFVELGRFKSVNVDMDTLEEEDDTNQTVSTTGAGVQFQAVGFAFKAPPSGRGLLIIRGDATISTAPAILLAGQIRQGTSVGAGTLTFDGLGAELTHLTWGQAGQTVTGITVPVSGLTPGDDYNASLRAAVSAAGSGTIRAGAVSWVPLY